MPRTEGDGGIMDSFKLDVSTKTLTLGDDCLDYGTMKLRLKDENHLTLITGDSTYELTKVPEPED